MKIVEVNTTMEVYQISVTLEDSAVYLYNFENTAKALTFSKLVRIAVVGDVDCPAVGEYLTDLALFARNQ